MPQRDTGVGHNPLMGWSREPWWSRIFKGHFTDIFFFSFCNVQCPFSGGENWCSPNFPVFPYVSYMTSKLHWHRFDCSLRNGNVERVMHYRFEALSSHWPFFSSPWAMPLKFTWGDGRTRDKSALGPWLTVWRRVAWFTSDFEHTHKKKAFKSKKCKG